jgi:hypothetical protein
VGIFDLVNDVVVDTDDEDGEIGARGCDIGDNKHVESSIILGW